MTKSLTEKWKDETLKGGFYWLKVDVGDGEYVDIVEYDEDGKDFVRYYNDYIKEVLAPVPSYEEYNELLDLNVYDKLQKENKKLKEQIEEANKLILWCARLSWTGDQREDIFDKYLAKWGVK